MLDADDKWHPKRLQRQIDVIESSNEIGLVHGNIEKISEKGVSLGLAMRENKYLSGHIFKYLFLRKAEISALTVLFRKSCVDTVGLFDESPVCMGCDDRDLWLRISRKFKIVYLDEVLAFYRVHPGNYSKNIENMLKARLFVIDKFSDCGEARNLKRQALAVIYKEAGDQFLLQKKFNESRKQYLNSVYFNPFGLWVWVNFVKALFHIEVKNVC